MKKDELMSKDSNVSETRVATIEIVKLSANLEMIKDNSGVVYDSSVLHFLVPKGAKVRYALREAMEVLKTQTDKTSAVLKYKEFEVSFGKDEEFAELMDYICEVEDFMKKQAVLSHSKFSAIEL